MEYIENKIKHEYLQYCSLYKCLVLSGQLVYNYLRGNVLEPLGEFNLGALNEQEYFTMTDSFEKCQFKEHIFSECDCEFHQQTKIIKNIKRKTFNEITRKKINIEFIVSNITCEQFFVNDNIINTCLTQKIEGVQRNNELIITKIKNINIFNDKNKIINCNIDLIHGILYSNLKLEIKEPKEKKHEFSLNKINNNVFVYITPEQSREYSFIEKKMEYFNTNKNVNCSYSLYQIFSSLETKINAIIQDCDKEIEYYQNQYNKKLGYLSFTFIVPFFWGISWCVRRLYNGKNNMGMIIHYRDFKNNTLSTLRSQISSSQMNIINIDNYISKIEKEVENIHDLMKMLSKEKNNNESNRIRPLQDYQSDILSCSTKIERNQMLLNNNINFFKDS